MKHIRKEDLKEIEKEFEDLLKTLDNQLSDSSNNGKSKFHMNLIDIMEKHPNSKELIQFMVGINDSLGTQQETFEDNIILSVKNIINIKMKLIKLIISDLEPTFKERVISSVKKSPIKYTVFGLLGILLLLALFFIPAKLMALLGMIVKIKGI